MNAGGMLEGIRTSETSVDTQPTTRRYIPEDGTLPNIRYLPSALHELCQPHI
jgi:hypothetical protein